MCPSWKPFQCVYGECIPLQYLCDGSRDCTNGYDEDINMCTAARRPPAIETAALFMQLNAVHGEDFLANLFGEKARGNFVRYGGVLKIAIALSESPTYRQFAQSIHMPPREMMYFVRTLEALSESNLDDVKDLGFSNSEIPVMKFYTDNLRRTGFF
ncbi:unnamed protein product [Soboliphyme baturini]|uniref:Prohormone-4 n=1 Tax=Soboliphyme baturini TaxID=241478 RepID=A0A183IHZ7_9BILA|nr:unnamed protein product [Soboliphyme baturini]